MMNESHPKSLGHAVSRILVADHDDAVRSALATALRADGYHVLEASDGWDLFWIVETAERGRGIELVVSDVRMPGYFVLDVVEAWAESSEGPRVVLLGAVPSADVRSRANALGVALLEKPVDASRLRELVRELLMSREASVH